MAEGSKAGLASEQGPEAPGCESVAMVKSLDDIMVARAEEQLGSEDFKLAPEKTHACPAPGCVMRYAPQSKLKLCPVHSKVVYAQRAKANRARYEANQKAKAAK